MARVGVGLGKGRVGLGNASLARQFAMVFDAALNVVALVSNEHLDRVRATTRVMMCSHAG